MKRVLRICIFCMLLTLLSIPVYAGENQLENTADFLQETLQWMQAPLTVEISEEGETKTLFTADPVEVEEDGFHGLALQIEGRNKRFSSGIRFLPLRKTGNFMGWICPRLQKIPPVFWKPYSRQNRMNLW